MKCFLQKNYFQRLNCQKLNLILFKLECIWSFLGVTWETLNFEICVLRPYTLPFTLFQFLTPPYFLISVPICSWTPDTYRWTGFQVHWARFLVPKIPPMLSYSCVQVLSKNSKFMNPNKIQTLPWVLKPSEHESEHSKSIWCTSEILHVDFHKNFCIVF